MASINLELVESRRTRLKDLVRQAALRRWAKDPNKATRMADLGVKLLERCFQASDTTDPLWSLSEPQKRYLINAARFGHGRAAVEAKQKLKAYGIDPP